MKNKTIILLLLVSLLVGCSTLQEALYDVPSVTPTAEVQVQPKPIVTAAVEASKLVPIPYLSEILSVLVAGGALAIGTQKKIRDGATKVKILHGVIDGLDDVFKDTPELKKDITKKIVSRLGTKNADLLGSIVKKLA